MNTSKLIEPEIIINTDTREIHIPEELYKIGVVSDNNAESVKIRVPRYFDGNDFSTKDCTISFNNALNERGVYEVTEMDLFDDTIVITWNISNLVTKKYGIINFVVEFKKKFDERGKAFSWSTTPAQLYVMNGLDDEIVNDKNDYSLYVNLMHSIQATDQKVSEIMQKISQIETQHVIDIIPITNEEIDTIYDELTVT